MDNIQYIPYCNITEKFWAELVNPTFLMDNC